MAYDKTQLTEQELAKVQEQQSKFASIKVSLGRCMAKNEEVMAEYRIVQAELSAKLKELNEKYPDAGE